MVLLNLLIEIDNHKTTLYRSHRGLVAKNLSDKELDEKIEKAFLKLNSFANMIQRKFGFKETGGEYNAPGDNAFQANNFTEDNFKSRMSLLEKSLEKMRDTLKNDNYKIIDKNTNKSEKLSNPAKSLLTKAIKDVSELKDYFNSEEKE